MSRSLMPAILFLAILAAPLPGQAQQSNLVLNLPYDFHPASTYHLTKDDGDSVQLTDGHNDASSWALWLQKSAICWMAGVDVPVVIRFDLGRWLLQTLNNSVDLRCRGFGGIEEGHQVPVAGQYDARVDPGLGIRWEGIFEPIGLTRL